MTHQQRDVYQFELINDKCIQSTANDVLQEKETTGVTKLSVYSLP